MHILPSLQEGDVTSLVIQYKYFDKNIKYLYLILALAYQTKIKLKRLENYVIVSPFNSLRRMHG
jgi:uncharacterized membrane protein